MNDFACPRQVLELKRSSSPDDPHLTSRGFGNKVQLGGFNYLRYDQGSASRSDWSAKGCG
jgi:hypothetical protein